MDAEDRGGGGAGLIVRGRVVDAEARPVAGAQVCLDSDFLPLPAIGQAARLEDCESTVTDASGEYGFDVTSDPGFSALHRPAIVRAFFGQRVSQQVILDWSGNH